MANSFFRQRQQFASLRDRASSPVGPFIPFSRRHKSPDGRAMLRHGSSRALLQGLGSLAFYCVSGQRERQLQVLNSPPRWTSFRMTAEVRSGLLRNDRRLGSTKGNRRFIDWVCPADSALDDNPRRRLVELSMTDWSYVTLNASSGLERGRSTKHFVTIPLTLYA